MSGRHFKIKALLIDEQWRPSLIELIGLTLLEDTIALLSWRWVIKTVRIKSYE